MPLNLHVCGLALNFLAVSTEAGDFTAWWCEHCDEPCEKKPSCDLCINLSRSEAKKTDR